ncbi:MAG: geranylgeranylglycerol-phosphate geranylgeranyltransferase [Flavobacteriales bacterium]|nr:geranylgeranylglycerol-phosphate geranylgeranyltransferase [Flavobacteriales bacterium]
MKAVYHFFRLIRSTNLLVISLTMVVFQLFISKYLLVSVEGKWDNFSLYELFKDVILTDFGFLLLMLSTLLIAAAGNIINDYFDVKADRVNKPERLIVGKHIKRRWAMVLHWFFNSSGILIAAYLAYVHKNWWILLISFISINLLWFYSSVYKRKFLSGNLMVAFLIFLVPIYVLVFNLNHLSIDNELNYLFDPSSFIIYTTLIIAGIAFLSNLIREIIKDIADVRGDMHIGAKTIPIQMGIKKAKIILIILIIPLLVLCLYYLFYVHYFNFNILEGSTMGLLDNQIPITPIHFNYFGISIWGAAILILASLITLLLSAKRKFYILSSNLLKLAMFFGLISPLFL